MQCIRQWYDKKDRVQCIHRCNLDIRSEDEMRISVPDQSICHQCYEAVKEERAVPVRTDMKKEAPGSRWPLCDQRCLDRPEIEAMGEAVGQ